MSFICDNVTAKFDSIVRISRQSVLSLCLCLSNYVRFNAYNKRVDKNFCVVIMIPTLFFISNTAIDIHISIFCMCNKQINLNKQGI